MFRILDYLFRPKNKKKPSGNLVSNEPVEKIKCKRCLRRYDSHYVKCPYCNYSELNKSINCYFFILRR